VLRARTPPRSGALAAVALLSFGLGAASASLARTMRRPRPESTAPAAVSGGAPPSAPEGEGARVAVERLQMAMALGKLLAHTSAEETLDWSDPAAMTRLHAKALNDPALRRELIERFRTAPDGDAKNLLGDLLSHLQTPEVVELSMQLATSQELKQRKDGFALLAGLHMKLPQVRQLARHALQADTDPEITTRAIAALEPAPADQGEVKQVSSELRRFVNNDDPAVRAQAITALGGWDKEGETADVLQKGLVDSSPEVRRSSVAAITANRIRSPQLKTQLLEVVRDTNQPADLRLDASMALEHFPLDATEYALVTVAAKEADHQLYPGTNDNFPQ
jgi:hypothetical protein